MTGANANKKAPRNRTISLSEDEMALYQRRLLKLSGSVQAEDIENRIINQDLIEVMPWLPISFVDLLFIDPPYNLTKSFNGATYRERSTDEYEKWIESWLPELLRTVKPSGSVYICADWRSSTAIHRIAERYLIVRNRITWEREKGRGAETNWKNCSEDVWFCTVSQHYTFNVDAVKLKRRVRAPYTDSGGTPKDWVRTEEGGYRLTYPSNLWTDLTVPFWSMPENTDHPTQKPEKLLAKIILASSNPGDIILDPFAGSGTACVVAEKLGRRYTGIEINRAYCSLAEKRLHRAAGDSAIQGYTNGVFWERNSLRHKAATAPTPVPPNLPLPGIQGNEQT